MDAPPQEIIELLRVVQGPGRGSSTRAHTDPNGSARAARW
jgi:hypothetical protein